MPHRGYRFVEKHTNNNTVPSVRNQEVAYLTARKTFRNYILQSGSPYGTFCKSYSHL
jgi:hypothetical protein